MKASAEPVNPVWEAGLYLRLSKDDKGVQESASIENQRKMLVAYADENRFRIAGVYIDDGYSGTNFERPGFQQMIKDIEAGFINLVLTKDLSRLGRDYIMTGQYTELFFPEHGVRYIAVNDGYDSAGNYNDIAPFKNVVNELYARDTSKKIRSSFLTKMEEGLYIGNFAPYGYQKDPENKNHLVVDEETAPVVKLIFSLAELGKRPKEIAAHLNSLRLPTPAQYRCQKNRHLNIDDYSKRKEWTSATIGKMLRNVVYLGHMAQHKTTKLSFKSKVTVANPVDDWIVVKHTHEAIVTTETFEAVRSQMQGRAKKAKSDFRNLFSSIAVCADCGRNMSATGTRKSGEAYQLVCGGYKLYGTKECSNHFISYSALCQIVQTELKKHLAFSEMEKERLLCQLERGLDTSVHVGRKAQERRLNELNRRSSELDTILQALYEDKATGKISEERFAKLSVRFETEQQEIEQRREALSKEMGPKIETNCSSTYRRLVEELTEVRNLTPELLHKLIEHIEVGQGYYDESHRKHQTLKIIFR